MPMSDFFGWNLLYKIIEKDIKKKSDVLIAITHWALIRDFGLECIGIGEDRTICETDKGDELLPSGWNVEEKSYAIRYRKDEKLFILLGTLSEETLILNILNCKTLGVSNSAFNVADTVKSMRGSLDEMIPNFRICIERLRTELLDAISETIIQTTTTQTIANPQEDIRPLPEIPESFRYPPRHVPPFRDREYDPTRNVGRADLDPFGRGGGGMLFNPPGLNFQPPGLVYPDGRRPNIPPGARFDPFSTPDPERLHRTGPDNDHLPPPGYDDMFM